MIATCPGVGVKKGATPSIVASQSNSNADDKGNTLTVECFARGK